MQGQFLHTGRYRLIEKSLNLKPAYLDNGC
jgi:hypothetical protein